MLTLGCHDRVMHDGNHVPTIARIIYHVVLPLVAIATPVMLAGMAMRARRQGLSSRSAALLFLLPLAAALPLIALMIWIAKAALG